jgi:hypothetical protein
MFRRKKEETMGIKKIIPIFIVLLFIFPVKALYPQGGPGSTDVNTVKNYVDQLKALSEEYDESKFNEIIKAPQDFKGIIVKDNKELENDWTGKGEDSNKLDKGYAADLGMYLAKIIKNNLDNPERIKLVGEYIKELSKALSRSDYVTAAWKVYNNICLELASTADGLPPAIKKLNKQFAQIKETVYQKKKEALNKLTELGEKLIEEIPIFHLLNINEKLKKEISDLKPNGKTEDTQQGKTEDKKEKAEDQQVIPGDKTTGKWLKNFIETRVAWFIIGLVIILFIAVSIFSFFFVYIRRQLQVKIPHSLDNNEPNGEKFRPINDEVLRLSTEIADLKKLKEKYIKPMTEKDAAGEEGEGSKIDYDSFSKSIKDDIDTKIEDLKINLKLASYEKIGDQLSDILGQMKILTGKPEKSEQFVETMANYERDVLKKIWMWKWQSSEKEKGELLRLAKEMEDKKVFFDQCYELGKQIGFNDELSSYYETILKPLLNYQHKLKEIDDSLKVIKKETSSTPLADLFEIKQKAHFLISLQNLNEVPELIKFKLENWFKEEFLDFADQFLRKYQSEEFHRALSEEMETAKDKILDILSFFDIEPIPIVLGQTAFDSQVHTGQSNVRDSSMIDGAIAEVIKNGFKEKQGKVRIRPEVIVNRL